MYNEQSIIFYDGNCGLCNRSVQFVLRHESSVRLKFSALQSDFAQQFFATHQFPIPDLSTFYFYTNNRIYEKSDAAFKVIPYLKWYWQPLRFFSVLPIRFTDSVYNFIAKRRKEIGGTFCVIPSAENKIRFIH